MSAEKQPLTLTRREFLKIASFVTGGLLASSCVPKASPVEEIIAGNPQAIMTAAADMQREKPAAIPTSTPGATSTPEPTKPAPTPTKTPVPATATPVPPIETAVPVEAPKFDIGDVYRADLNGEGKIIFFKVNDKWMILAGVKRNVPCADGTLSPVYLDTIFRNTTSNPSMIKFTAVLEDRTPYTKISAELDKSGILRGSISFGNRLVYVGGPGRGASRGPVCKPWETLLTATKVGNGKDVFAEEYINADPGTNLTPNKVLQQFESSTYGPLP